MPSAGRYGDEAGFLKAVMWSPSGIAASIVWRKPPCQEAREHFDETFLFLPVYFDLNAIARYLIYLPQSSVCQTQNMPVPLFRAIFGILSARKRSIIARLGDRAVYSKYTRSGGLERCNFYMRH